MLISKLKAKVLAMMMVMLLSFSVFSIPMNAKAESDSGNTSAALVDTAALEKRTSDYVSQFINGNFDYFYNASTKLLQQQLPASVLKQGWDTVIAMTGKPSKSISCVYTKQNALDIVTDTIEGTLYNIVVTITYSADGKPAGIWTSIIPKDPPKPQITDKWKEIAVTVGDKKLPGMLTLPKGVKNPPVVIMIQGSGPSDMNESVGSTPNRPFEDIAHGLAKLGVATLRYNKATYQYLGASVDTIEYEVLDDASAAVKMLSKDKRIDKNRIYLLGHSLGGMMAPKITYDNPQIKGFISMAGTLRTFQDMILDQNKAALKALTTLTEQQKKDQLLQIEAELEKTKNLDNSDSNNIMGLTANYWKSLNAVDSLAIVKKLKVPMLILQGSADFQVYADKDYKLWQTTLKSHKNVTYHLYKDLSHEFMPNQISENGFPDVSVYNAPNHVDPKVIKDISVWVKKQ